jgi:RNA polymerase sigma-70 factor (ECF subfamily)
MRKPARIGLGSNVNAGSLGPSRHAESGSGDAGENAGIVKTDPATGDTSPSDAWLVEHARRGDQEAFAALVGRYERKLICVLARLVRDPEQARDLAQETFWRVYNRLDRFDTGRRFGPWLFRIGVNLALDWLRGSKNEIPAATSGDRIRGDDTTTLELRDPDPRIRAELAQEIEFVLTLLPITYRKILILRDLEGFSSSEVAAIIGRREATVRWRLAQAREKFREIWCRRQDGAWNAQVKGKDGKERHGQDDE